MDLKFLGRGGAFNYKEGNNSAYFIDNNELFLIDCGESVFSSIMDSGVLKNIQAVNVLITHTHSDHVGSLGTFVAYVYYIMGKVVSIVVPTKNQAFTSGIKAVFKVFGSDVNSYKLVDETCYDNKYKLFSKVRFLPSSHVQEINSCGILFNTTNGVIYFSGDTNSLDNVNKIIKSGEVVDKIYIDTTLADYPGNVHLYLGVLKENVPKELRNKFYCMHINSEQCINKAKQLGFNVVENIHKKQIDK